MQYILHIKHIHPAVIIISIIEIRERIILNILLDQGFKLMIIERRVNFIFWYIAIDYSS